MCSRLKQTQNDSQATSLPKLLQQISISIPGFSRIFFLIFRITFF